MQRRNGDIVRFRPRGSAPAADAETRPCCRICGRVAARGQDRPYCLEHAPYAIELRRALARAV